jgi:hypothetical protein
MMILLSSKTILLSRMKGLLCSTERGGCRPAVVQTFHTILLFGLRGVVTVAASRGCLIFFLFFRLCRVPCLAGARGLGGLGLAAGDFAYGEPGRIGDARVRG